MRSCTRAWVLCFLLAAVMVSAVSTAGAQYMFRSTMLRVIGEDVSRYPHVALQCVLLDGGKPLSWDTSQGINGFSISERGASYPVLSWSRPARPSPFRLHVFADLHAVSWEELLAVEEVLTRLVMRPEVAGEVSYYVPKGEGYQRLSHREFNKLKLSNQEVGRPTVVSFEKYVAANDSMFSHDLPLVIFLVDQMASDDLARLSRIASAVRRRVPLFYGLLATRLDLWSIPTSQMETLLFAERSQDANQRMAERLLELFGRLGMAQQSCTFRLPVTTASTGTRQLDLAWKRNPSAPELRTGVRLGLSDSAAHGAVVDEALALATELSGRGDYAAALDTLASAGATAGRAPFQSHAYDLLRTWGEGLAVGSDSTAVEAFAQRAEGDWGLQPSKDPWYAALKTNIVEQQIAALGPGSLNRMVSLKEELSKLRGDAKTSAEFFMLRSTSRRQAGDLWGAAHDLATGLGLQPDDLKTKDLGELVLSALRHSYDQKEYRAACDNMRSFGKFLESRFVAHFMLARCCQEAGDQQSAVKQYEWLVQNWQSDQKLLTWEEALGSLQRLQSSTLRLPEAYGLSRRDYRQRGDEDALRSAIGNLRGYALLPALTAYGLFLERGGREPQAIARVRNGIAPKLPASLRGFYLLNGGGRPAMTIGGSVGVPARGFPGQRAGLVFDAVAKRFWLFERMTVGLLAAEFTADLSGHEGALVSEIRKNRMLEMPWKQLADLQVRSGVRVLGEMSAAAVALEQRNRGALDGGPLARALKDHDAILYVAVYDRKGTLVYNAGLEISKCSADQILWRKSLTTPAFLLQDIQYENAPALDITTPIPDPGGKVSGVVKLGIRKL